MIFPLCRSTMWFSLCLKWNSTYISRLRTIIQTSVSWLVLFGIIVEMSKFGLCHDVSYLGRIQILFLVKYLIWKYTLVFSIHYHSQIVVSVLCCVCSTLLFCYSLAKSILYSIQKYRLRITVFLMDQYIHRFLLKFETVVIQYFVSFLTIRLNQIYSMIILQTLQHLIFYTEMSVDRSQVLIFIWLKKV